MICRGERSGTRLAASIALCVLVVSLRTNVGGHAIACGHAVLDRLNQFCACLGGLESSLRAAPSKNGQARLTALLGPTQAASRISRSALPWAILARSAVETGSASRNARARALDANG